MSNFKTCSNRFFQNLLGVTDVEVAFDVLYVVVVANKNNFTFFNKRKINVSKRRKRVYRKIAAFYINNNILSNGLIYI
jgi:hypothetical protein